MQARIAELARTRPAHLVARTVDRVLRFKGSTTLRRSGSKRWALLSYVVPPPWEWPFYFRVSHANRMKAWRLGRALQGLGYNVDIRRYDDANLEGGHRYDLLLGHSFGREPGHFTRVASRMRTDIPKLLLLTEPSPLFINDVVARRMQALHARRPTAPALPAYASMGDYTDDLRLADHALLIGNNTIRNTWPTELRERISLLDNTSGYATRRRRGRTSGVLFMSSDRQVQRGLDVALEAFAEHTDPLWICSLVRKEEAFCERYERELFQSPHIRTLGFVPTAGPAFHSVVEQCDFVLLPAAAEGQSSSVVALACLGLLPLVTREAGLPEEGFPGFWLEEGSVDAIVDVMNRVRSLDLAELEQRRDQLWRYVERFSAQAFHLAATKLLAQYVQGPTEGPSRSRR